jgi:uncharacterized protein
MTHLEAIARETGLSFSSVSATAKLLAEGATVPFISRYRKEQTGSLDEVQITTIRDRMIQLAELDSRRSTILKSLEERSLLTPELKKKVEAAATLATLEDVFAPFRPKRQTRATKAIERGLAPLADWLLANQAEDPAEEAAKFIDAENGVATADDALAGARDVIAERVAEDAALRGRVRKLYEEEAMVSSKIMYGKEEEPDAQKFRDYFEWSESLRTIPSHRMLAIRRGEKEGFLLMRIEVPFERITSQALPEWVKSSGAGGRQVALAVEDGCKRLLMPSMETEARLLAKSALMKRPSPFSPKISVNFCSPRHSVSDEYWRSIQDSARDAKPWFWIAPGNFSITRFSMQLPVLRTRYTKPQRKC